MATAPAFIGLAPSVLASSVNTFGFAIADGVVELQTVDSLIVDMNAAGEGSAVRKKAGQAFGIRDLFNVVPATRVLAETGVIRSFAEAIVGPGARLVRGLFFDKTLHANWKVSWHQDLTIAVRQKRNVEGFGPWSIKAGIHHVQPPAKILDRMIAIRVHLDDTNQSNGALKVIPRSHLFGRLTHTQIENLTNEGLPVVCDVARGGVLLMRPLLLHSSSICSEPSNRRVIHLEFAGADLPGGLEWSSS